MRKLILCLILLLLPVPVFADVVATGSVSQANMKLSTVNGTAFVDFSAAGVFTGYEGLKLTITDSTGDKLIGYIKAMGTGETLGASLINDASFAAGCGVNWVCQPGWTMSGGEAISDGTSNDSKIYQAHTFVAGTLYKSSLMYILTSGGGQFYFTGRVGSLTSNDVFFTAPSSNTLNAYIYSSNFLVASVQSWALNPVTAPSATGATIVDAKGGSTFNWTSKDASFTPNDASGYTYTIERQTGGMSLMWW